MKLYLNSCLYLLVTQKLSNQVAHWLANSLKLHSYKKIETFLDFSFCLESSQ